MAFIKELEYKMKRGKWKWIILLVLGSIPFLVALGFCFVSSLLDGGGLLKMSFVDYLLGYSFLYWPTYVIGIILIAIYVGKLKNKH